MKANFKTKFFLFFIASIFVVGGFIFAGNINPIPPDPSPSMYTLEDIYNLIHSTSTVTTPTHTLSPAAGKNTSATSSYSVSQIYVDLANLIKRENLVTGTEYLGVTGDYNNPDPAYATTTANFLPSLTPTTASPEAVGYTLNDIKNLIIDSTPAIEANHDFTPPGSPSGSGGAISEIYGRLTTLINPVMIKSGVTYLGVTGTYVPNPFNSTWDTTLISDGSSANNQITLPLGPEGTYNFIVNWGDDTTSHITSWNQAEVTHTYNTPGPQHLSINGTIIGFRFGYSGDRLKLTNISKWGDLKLGNDGGYFYGCDYLSITTTDDLNLSGTIDLSNTFNSIADLGGDISNWDVSAVTNMNNLFNNTNFNQDISAWDVSKVQDMGGMFQGTPFNQDISSWDVSSVTNMSWMFTNNSQFNQNIGAWDVHNVATMFHMFFNTTFNQDISAWDVSSVTNMGWMFYNNTSFNQNLSGWNVLAITTKISFDEGATAWTNPAWKPIFP